MEKIKSHLCRMSECFICSPVAHIDISMLVNKSEYVASVGRVLTRRSFQKIDRVKEMSAFTINDFSLENLLAIGANMSPASLSSNAFESLTAFSKEPKGSEVSE